MKILTWNVRLATASNEPLWNIVRLADPDIALLQELSSVPSWIRDRYHVYIVAPMFFYGRAAKFNNAVLSKWPIQAEPFLSSSLDFVNSIHSKQYGWLLECQIEKSPSELFRVVCVHSPFWAIPKENLKNCDISAIKLPQKQDLWYTELLWSLLKDSMKDKNWNWIVGGDFNSSVLFDIPNDQGNREVRRRLNECGLTDCLSHYTNIPVPTFRTPKGLFLHQLDYCYVSNPLLPRLKEAWVLSDAEVFGRKKMLSDHLPIICEFW